MSRWNSHPITEEEASNINCLPHTMQSLNPSPGNLSTVYTLAHVKPAIHMMTWRIDYLMIGGLVLHRFWAGLCTLCPLLLVKRILPTGNV